MPIDTLSPHQLRLTIDPATLGFVDTAELADEALPWIGQARAEAAARFGLGMDQPNYNLFVLGEVGSGRSSLLRQAMVEAAAKRRVPPDLCYLHNFDTPERPLALRLPAGAGTALQEALRHFKRQALHAEALGLTHPDSGEPMHWQVPPPEDMQRLLEVLRDDAHD